MNPHLRSVGDSAYFLQRARLKLQACDLRDKHFGTGQQFLAYLVKIVGNGGLDEVLGNESEFSL